MTDDDPIPRAVFRAIPPQGTATMTELHGWTGFSVNTVRGALALLHYAGLIVRIPSRPGSSKSRSGRSCDWRRT